LNVTEDRTVFAFIVAFALLRLTVPTLDEKSWTKMSEVALAGSPVSSVSSTVTVPVSEGLARRAMGVAKTPMWDGNPLGVKVEIWAVAEASPADEAVIVVVPGVVVAVKFTTV
jgi:hypothetical protein